MGFQVFIVAGDPSGDIHAARLMNELAALEPTATFSGIGGPAMERAGLQPIVPFAPMNVSGFWEVARHYRTLRAAFNAVCDHCMRAHYDLFIPVDYPGFNIPLALRLRKRGIPVFWYIAPQLWAWGEWRARRLAAALDRLFVVLPFEVEFFRRYGIDAEYHGHPFLDDPAYATSHEAPKHPQLIALLPGRRPHEIALHIKPMLGVAHLLHRDNNSWQFAAACQQPDWLRSVPPHVWFNPSAQEVLLAARYGLIKAGTSTLEAMLAGVIHVAMYRASVGTYLVGRMLIQIPYIALPNIILGRKVVPEVVQTTATIQQAYRAMVALLTDAEEQQRQLDAAREIRTALGGSGASRRIAERMLTLLGRR